MDMTPLTLSTKTIHPALFAHLVEAGGQLIAVDRGGVAVAKFRMIHDRPDL